MFGWRARIGYLCPSVFEMIAYDFYRVVPSGVGLIGVTCMIDGWQSEAYRKGLDRVEECAKELGRRSCDFIIHAGVPLVVSQGVGFEREIIARVERMANVPATTSIVAGIEALQALSVRRVGLVNPYPADLNAAVVSFLKSRGFQVTSVVSLGADFTAIGNISEADVYSAVKDIVREAPETDGLYLPCPQFPVLDIIEAIETDFGMPVVGHLPSEIWKAFRTLQIRQPIRGFGRLLAGV